MSEVKAGDWVRTCRHRHHGKVLVVYPDCPENDLWKQTQVYLTDEQLEGEWALIFDPKNASVLVPVSDCEPAEEIPLTQFPDQIAIEAFGATEEETRQIAESLGQLDGTVGHLVGITVEGDPDE